MHKDPHPAAALYARLKDYARLLYKSPKRIAQEDWAQKEKAIDWQTKRLTVLFQANYRCSVCGQITFFLEPTPILPLDQTAIEDYQAEDLIAVCPKCEKDQPFRIHQENALLRAFRLARFKPTELAVLSTMFCVHKSFIEEMKSAINEFATSDFSRSKSE